MKKTKILLWCSFVCRFTQLRCKGLYSALMGKTKCCINQCLSAVHPSHGDIQSSLLSTLPWWSHTAHWWRSLKASPKKFSLVIIYYWLHILKNLLMLHELFLSWLLSWIFRIFTFWLKLQQHRLRCLHYVCFTQLINIEGPYLRNCVLLSHAELIFIILGGNAFECENVVLQIRTYVSCSGYRHTLFW